MKEVRTTLPFVKLDDFVNEDDVNEFYNECKAKEFVIRL